MDQKRKQMQARYDAIATAIQGLRPRGRVFKHVHGWRRHDDEKSFALLYLHEQIFILNQTFSP